MMAILTVIILMILEGTNAEICCNRNTNLSIIVEYIDEVLYSLTTLFHVLRISQSMLIFSFYFLYFYIPPLMQQQIGDSLRANLLQFIAIPE